MHFFHTPPAAVAPISFARQTMSFLVVDDSELPQCFSHGEPSVTHSADAEPARAAPTMRAFALDHITPVSRNDDRCCY